MASTGQLVSQARRSKRLTQEALAEHIGVSRQTIAMWEIGRQLPTDSVAILTARFLGVDEEKLLSLLQRERLVYRVERLQEQYGANIIIAERLDHGGGTMNTPKYTAHQAQHGVHFAVTHIYKSIDFEYPEKLMESKKGKEGFDAPFEISRLGECLIIKMLVQSEDETFIPNWHYIGYCEIVDDLGNRFWPIGMGMRASVPPEAQGGGIIQAFSRFRYVPEARSITLRQGIANSREEDCDLITFENVKLTDEEVTKQINDSTITYSGFKATVVKGHQKIHQIHIRLHQRGNPKYVGIHKVTDNLGNEYNVHGFSWTLDDRNEEGFPIKDLAPEAESISFKYLIAKTVLDFQFPDLPIPS